MIDEGYVKYNCNWIPSSPLPDEEIQELNLWRSKLYQLGLIGIYDNGIGFGNISIRAKKPGQFLVSGTQTGKIAQLTNEHYTTVIDFDLEKNSLTCEGAIAASSESLTHAVIYEANSQIKAIIHVHNLQMWQNLMFKIPTSSPDCPYGTPEMAKEILRLFAEADLMTKKILVMGGHEEGIISFGENLDTAGNLLLKYYNSQ
ncbi:MAG: class II aldolase/adducin family protein [Oscillatoria sp. PMC 1051.18]|nr:class II aldolase/adducin family protein [Oscillatoria sp. PMC 1050.18]MEC5033276.1 class II aldolase/adducin family protein [Oscillatoria sp. PMC 1051.18]NET90171.1 class II aldolase/adducin family protein [Kamptonema sp. SIO1D9]